ncbi:MAG: hypothetical protein EXR62_12900 [Chloroflexi bacterium]|nr:hypothetical protein [Chloroflexota bacterium]
MFTPTTGLSALPGDANQDCHVGVDEIQAIAAKQGLKWNETGYHMKYDPTQDGKIDVDDLAAASANWHSDLPGCTGVVILKTYFLGDKAVAIRQGGALRYLHTDHLGSTSLLTDDRGQVVAASGQRYMPYGKGRAGQVAPLPSERAFTGQALDNYINLN